MPIFTGNDDSTVLTERLSAWLRTRPGYESAVVDPISQATSGTGWSNETYKVRFARTPGAEPETCILRIPPREESLLPDYDVVLQYNTMKALEGIDGYPVVRGRWLESDPTPMGRPFFLMEFAHGAPASDSPIYYNAGWVVDASEEERRTMWVSTVDAIGRLASVDWRARGLGMYEWPDRNRSCIEQNLERWERIYDWGASFFPDVPLPAMVVELRDWLRAHLPAEHDIALNWGDARFANIIFRDFRPAALLDWELAMAGDPDIDITFFLFADRHLRLLAGGTGPLPTLTGFLPEAATLERYERTTGRKVRNPNFYWLFNAYRIYGVRQRIAGLSVKWGIRDRADAIRLREVPTLADDVRRRMAMGPAEVADFC